jgi:hypothetical protein
MSYQNRSSCSSGISKESGGNCRQLQQRKRVVLVLKRLGSRSVENHDEMVQVLKQKLIACQHFSPSCESEEEEGGSSLTSSCYEVRELEASSLTVEKQAQAFAQADVLIAPHGSGLTNALFMTMKSGNGSLPDQSSNSNSSPVLVNPDEDSGRFPLVVELLPWEYPNLTFYVALEWLAKRHGGPGLSHAFFLVAGGDAFRPMKVDAPALAIRLVSYLGSALKEDGYWT